MKPVGIKKSGLAALKALFLMVAFGIVAHAGLPYLPLVGPPALRIQVAKDPHAAVVPLLADEKNSTNTLAAIEVTALNPAATNAEAASAATLADTLPLIGVGAPNAFSENYGAPMLGMNSPDFLNITPAILATYFRPVAWGTNTGFVGPFPAGFVPPYAQRDKASHAEYQVK